MGGESALRLDVPAGKLHAFGASLAIDEAFVVLAAVLFLSALFLLVTLVLGRVWCGWSCPQTVLGDVARLLLPVRRAPSVRPPSTGPERSHGAERRRGVEGRTVGWVNGRVLRDGAGYAALALLSAVVAASVLWYFVSPYDFFRRLAAGTLGPVLTGAWAALGAIVFLDLVLVGATFCATVCPYAKLQGVLFDRSTLVVAYDRHRAADCVSCGACVRVCPTGIDIRDGLQAECIACAACVDACAPIMARLGKPGNLVGYFFGEPGAPRRLGRPGVLALAGATAAALALLAGVAAGREVLAMTALADETFAPRRAAEGRVVNVFSVALENRTRHEVDVALALRAPGAEVALRPDHVALGPGERRQVRVVASAIGLAAAGRVPAELDAEARGGGRGVARQRVPFVVPEVR